MWKFDYVHKDFPEIKRIHFIKLNIKCHKLYTSLLIHLKMAGPSAQHPGRHPVIKFSNVRYFLSYKAVILHRIFRFVIMEICFKLWGCNTLSLTGYCFGSSYRIFYILCRKFPCMYVAPLMFLLQALQILVAGVPFLTIPL
jgi:hypothetical protein